MMRRFKHVLVPEMNLGQLRTVLRDRFMVDAKGLNKVRGQPFTIGESCRASIRSCAAR
jgi:2-oxoglutarate ferredoxin oxidoreductase subunit alpha